MESIKTNAEKGVQSGEVFTRLSLGTWTYIFQGLLVLSLMILRKRFVPPYLFSFVVEFVFGELLDVHKAWISVST